MKWWSSYKYVFTAFLSQFVSGFITVEEAHGLEMKVIRFRGQIKFVCQVRFLPGTFEQRHVNTEYKHVKYVRPKFLACDNMSVIRKLGSSP